MTEDPLETLVDGLPLAALVLRDGAVVRANPVARSLLADGGAAPDGAALAVDDRRLRDAAARAVADGVTVDSELVHARRELQVRAVPVGHGQAVVLLTDATENRRVEAMRRDFVTNASHELKTPAASMQALAESIALAIDRDPPRARSMVARLHHEATRLSTMVRDLLDLARLEDDGVRRPRPVDVGEIVREQLQRYGEQAKARALTVDDAGVQPAVVQAPPEDVRLVVGNLIENAVRYNREGGLVRVATRVEGDRAVLEVADTGIGIAEADQSRIFERFYRVDKARSRAAGGTGLGLSLVRHAAEHNGGDVTVSSAVDEGSRFRVTLPAAQPSMRSPVTK